MEKLRESLNTLFRESFHVVPIDTHRQDQWFKRHYEDWRERHNGLNPLLLTPKDSREEWTPRVSQFAVTFSELVRKATREKLPSLNRRQTSVEPSALKLFQDDVLDQSQTIFQQSESPYEPIRVPLTPSMQRLTYWTEFSGKGEELQEHADGISALLGCGQIEALLYLATRAQNHIKNIGPSEFKARFHNRDRGPIVGWQHVLDETLQLLFFLAALSCFAEDLVDKKNYERWVPFAYAPFTSAMARFIESQNEDKLSRSAIKQVQQQIDWCFDVICNERMFSEAADMPPIDLEQHVVDSFLYFLGFEACNRKRAGHGYLYNELNAGKYQDWLQQHMSHEDRQSLKEQSKKAKEETLPRPAKSRDPLRLREPKVEHQAEEDEEEGKDDEETKKLAALEAEETAYGRKRSSKYQRRR